MNRLKSKASNFFKHSLSQDEKIASVSPNQEANFDAGIERSLRKQPSRFFQKQADKSLPASPAVSSSSWGTPPLTPTDVFDTFETTADSVPEPEDAETNKLPPSRLHAQVTESQTRAVFEETSPNVVRKAKLAEPVIKKRPGFASLRKSSSRIFRSDTGNHDPPPPPLPQITTSTPTPPPRRPALRPFRTLQSSRPGTPMPVISRPVPSSQLTPTPTTYNPSKVDFAKPAGPAPPRPPRPSSIDYELIALKNDGSSRMVLPTQTETRDRTPTVSTTSTTSTTSSAYSSADPDSPLARLGLPSGHSSLDSPKSSIFDSPLAANFRLSPNRPLPFRRSNGEIVGYGRFSAWIKERQLYKSGGYEDGVEMGDRETGPIEMYSESRCADWTLERRVSGRLGERGMLFKDRWGGWHFVLDI